MKDRITVYWSSVLTSEYSQTNLLHLEIVPVLKDFVKSYKNQPLKTAYAQCPAATNFFKNTFVVKSPIDLEINLTQNPPSISIPGSDMPNANSLFTIRSFPDRLFDLEIPFTFISDTSLEMSQMPAFLHENNYTKSSSTFAGRFNIGKWIRPLYSTITLHQPKVKINRGDALFYVKFDTNKKIILKNFIHDNYTQAMINNCVNVKDFYRKIPFSKLYKMYQKLNQHKKLIKHLKNNLTQL